MPFDDASRRRSSSHADDDGGVRPAPGRVTVTARLPPRPSPAMQLQCAPTPSRAGAADASWSALFDVLAPAAGPVQRSGAVSLDKPPEWEEQRATIDEDADRAGGGYHRLHGAKLEHARRMNRHYHVSLRFDPAVFGDSADVGSDDFAEAVAAFQAAHGLAVDGVAGPKTCKAAGVVPTRAPAAKPGQAAATIDKPPEYDETRATIQERSAGPRETDDDTTRAIAARGIAGGGAPVPHLATLQTAFGRYSPTVGGVRAHVGGAAAHAAGAIGAHAYATGDDIAFASSPDLHLAAHEAAHVVQQRAGVSLAGGVGSAGDPYEVHADRVADAVVRGESAESILDEHAGGGGGTAVQARRRKHDGGEIDAAIRHLASTLEAARWSMVAAFTSGVPLDTSPVIDAATLLGTALAASPSKPPKATIARLEEAGEELQQLGDSLVDDAARPIHAAIVAIVDAARAQGVELHAPGKRHRLATASADDHEQLLAADIRLIDEEVTIAEVDMGAPSGEITKLTAHVHTVSVLLRDAIRHTAATPEGGGRAKLVDTIEKIDPSIKRLDDWGRNASASMATTGLEAMFDLEDRLYDMVQLRLPARAAGFYGGRTVKGADRTQRDLVDDLVRIYEADDTWVKGIAIDQMKGLLDEPPAPEKPELLATILETAVGAFAGAVPGKLGALVEALAGTLVEEHEEGGEGGTPTLTSIAGVITETVSDGVMDFVKESIKSDQEPAIRNRFVDGCRAALVQSVTNFGGALATYRRILERMPPEAVAQMHAGARAMPGKLWQGLKTDLIAQWMNFTAGLKYGAQDGDPKLKPGDKHLGFVGFDGTLEAEVHIGEGGVFSAPEVTSVAIANLAAPLIAELKASKTKLLSLPVHRYFEVSGDVNTKRRNEAVVMSASVGTLYLTASGELDISKADWYRLAEISRLGRYGATSDDFDSDPDEASPAYEALGDADHPIVPDLQVVPERQARAGAWKILRGITATTELLGGGDE